MSLPSVWSDLRRLRFDTVPEDCGNHRNPGVLDLPEHHDWSERETTGDQKRIEQYLLGFDLRRKRLLHIGAGNSELARRFSKYAGEIIGTTIEANEVIKAQLFRIPNYKIVLQNKYAAQSEQTPGAFDFIIDNNPLSFCCCMVHLVALFDFYRAKLASGGQIITDQLGLSWVPEAGHASFRIGYDDFDRLALAAGFSATRINRNIFILSESEEPIRPKRLRRWLNQIRPLLPG